MFNPRKIRSAAPAGPRFRWNRIEAMFDEHGKELKRFYQPETFASAFERAALTPRSFVEQTLIPALGTAELVSADFALVFENRERFVFYMEAKAKRKKALFAIVAAKRTDEGGEWLQAERGHLQALHQRAPKDVVEPFRGGTVYLPGKHGAEGRDVYAYMTRWPGGFDRVEAANARQFGVFSEGKHAVLGVAETETLRERIVSLWARFATEAGPDVPDPGMLRPGDLLVRRTGAGAPRLMLAACPRMLPKLAPPRLLGTLLTTGWECGAGTSCALAPLAPEGLAAALDAALGTPEMRRWLEMYCDAAKRGRAHGRGADYVDALAGCLVE